MWRSPLHRFADGLGVGRVVLLPLDIGLHIGRRHQPYGVAQRLQLTRPMTRRGAGLDPHEARRQLLEERHDMAPPQLAANDHIACRVDAVDLKHRLCDVKTDRRDRLHVELPPNRGRPLGNHLIGTYVPVEEPSTASEVDLERAVHNCVPHAAGGYVLVADCRALANKSVTHGISFIDLLMWC